MLNTVGVRVGFSVAVLISDPPVPALRLRFVPFRAEAPLLLVIAGAFPEGEARHDTASARVGRR